MKEKNEIISRLEDKTNQINATMKQLEQRYSPIFVSLHSQLHPLTSYSAFLQLPLKCDFQLEHLNQTFLKLLISALLLDWFLLFDKHTHSKYKLNLSVFILYHLSSGPRFLCWYQKLFFQLFQSSDSLLPTSSFPHLNEMQ